MHLKKEFDIQISYNLKNKKITMSLTLKVEKHLIKKKNMKIYLIVEKFITTIGITRLMKYNLICTNIMHVVEDNSIEKYLRGRNNKEDIFIFSSKALLLVHDNKIDDLKEKKTIFIDSNRIKKSIFIRKIINILYNQLIESIRHK